MFFNAFEIEDFIFAQAISLMRGGEVEKIWEWLPVEKVRRDRQGLQGALLVKIVSRDDYIVFFYCENQAPLPPGFSDSLK